LPIHVDSDTAAPFGQESILTGLSNYHFEFTPINVEAGANEGESPYLSTR